MSDITNFDKWKSHYKKVNVVVSNAKARELSEIGHISGNDLNLDNFYSSIGDEIKYHIEKVIPLATWTLREEVSQAVAFIGEEVEVMKRRQYAMGALLLIVTALGGLGIAALSAITIKLLLS